MAYYIEVRPRDTAPITLESYKERFAKILERHPSATDPEEDPERRESYVNDFLHPGGVLSVYECKKIPAGVTADARFSWGDREDGFRASVVMLAVIADEVSADLYMRDKRIAPGEEEVFVTDFTSGKRMASRMFGSIGGSAPA